MRYLASLLPLIVGGWRAAGAAMAEALPLIKLPPPQTTGGRPLLEALKLRSTSRAFAPDPLPPQTLSNLLWAAWGVNRAPILCLGDMLR